MSPDADPTRVLLPDAQESSYSCDQAFFENNSCTALGCTCDGATSIPLDPTLKASSTTSVKVTYVVATRLAFAAMTEDSHVYAWGSVEYGGKSTLVTGLSTVKFSFLYANMQSFMVQQASPTVAAGTLISWGRSKFESNCNLNVVSVDDDQNYSCTRFIGIEDEIVSMVSNDSSKTKYFQ